MLVKSRMTPNPITVTPETGVSSAFAIMKEHSIRRLPVVKGGKLVGIVTDKELQQVSPSKATTLSVFELNYLLEKTTIKDAMSRDPITVQDDDISLTSRMIENWKLHIACNSSAIAGNVR